MTGRLRRMKFQKILTLSLLMRNFKTSERSAKKIASVSVLDYFFADGQMTLIKFVLSLCPCQKKDVYVKYVSYLGLDELGVQMLRVKVTLRLDAYADSLIIYLLHFFLPIVLFECLYLSIRTRQLGVFHS